MTEIELASGCEFIHQTLDEIAIQIQRLNTKGYYLWDGRKRLTQIMQIVYGVTTYEGLNKLQKKLEKKQRDFYLAEAEFHDANLNEGR